MDVEYIDADDYDNKNQVMWKSLVWKNVNQINDDIHAIDADDADIVEYEYDKTLSNLKIVFVFNHLIFAS